MNTAMEAGYGACYDGFTKGQCGYSQASDEYSDWIDGWEQAAREIEDDAAAGEVDMAEHLSIYGDD